jgi:hypothetical protein
VIGFCVAVAGVVGSGVVGAGVVGSGVVGAGVVGSGVVGAGVFGSGVMGDGVVGAGGRSGCGIIYSLRKRSTKSWFLASTIEFLATSYSSCEGEKWYHILLGWKGHQRSTFKTATNVILDTMAMWRVWNFFMIVDDFSFYLTIWQTTTTNQQQHYV